MMNWCAIVLCTGFATLGAFLYGYHNGAINGAKEDVNFRRTLRISNSTAGNSSCTDNDIEQSALIGLILASYPLGCSFGAIIGGVLSQFIGRRYVMMLGSSVSTIGAVLQAASYHLGMFFAGTVTDGIGVGILFMVIPVYVGEIAPRKIRGRMVLAFGAIGIPSGFFLSSVVNLLLLRNYNFGWRISFGVQAAVGVVLFTSVIFMPESPRWLLKSGKEMKAEKVLKLMFGSNKDEQVVAEMNLIKDAVQNEDNLRKKRTSIFKNLFTLRTSHRVALAVCLQILRKFTGIDAVGQYSVTIFDQLGIPSLEATVAVGAVSTLLAPFGIYIIDKIGRKTLLLMGSVGMFVSMAAVGTLSLLFDLGSCGDEGSTVVGFVIVALVGLFNVSFACTWSGGVFVVVSEFFPLELKAFGVAVGTATYWICSIAVTQLTPIMLSSPLQVFGTMYCFAGAAFISFIFVLLTIPETKGYGLEEIEELFSQPWLKRTRVLYYLLCGCLWSKTYKALTGKKTQAGPVVLATNPMYSTQAEPVEANGNSTF